MGMGEKDMEGDGGKGCGGRWGQRVQRKMGTKDVEGDGGKGCGENKTEQIICLFGVLYKDSTSTISK